MVVIARISRFWISEFERRSTSLAARTSSETKDGTLQGNRFSQRVQPLAWTLGSLDYGRDHSAEGAASSAAPNPIN